MEEACSQQQPETRKTWEKENSTLGVSSFEGQQRKVCLRLYENDTGKELDVGKLVKFLKETIF